MHTTAESTHAGLRSVLTPPERAWTVSGWALLPLRAFLAFTFLFAGIQKLANPNFFDANSAISIQNQITGAARTSPIGSLVGHTLEHAVFFGVVIAVGEIAIGLGMALGLFTRIAALGGAVLSFSLFLVVSFHASPFYTGSDLVFLFAFLPFVVTGAGAGPAIDTLLAARRREAKGGAEPAIAAVVDRRAVVVGSSAVAATAVIAGAAAGIGRAVGGAPRAKGDTTNLNGGGSSSTTTTAPSGSSGSPKGTAIGAASAVAVGGAATFTAPNGDPGIVLQPKEGEFLAYDAVCPHAGCTVSYSKAADLIVCPCHASEFKVSNGDVIAGPSPTGLTKWKCAKAADGQLYIQT